MNFVGRMYGLDQQTTDRRADELLEFAVLGELADELNRIGGTGWILVLNLGYEQLKKGLLVRKRVDRGGRGTASC